MYVIKHKYDIETYKRISAEITVENCEQQAYCNFRKTTFWDNIEQCTKWKQFRTATSKLGIVIKEWYDRQQYLDVQCHPITLQIVKINEDGTQKIVEEKTAYPMSERTKTQLRNAELPEVLKSMARLNDVVGALEE